MTDLETKLAESRKQMLEGAFSYQGIGFDIAANIAREVFVEKERVISSLQERRENDDEHIRSLYEQIDEKDAEIARLKDANFLAAEVVRLEAQVKALAGPLGRVLVKLGVLRDDVSLTGPELIVAAETWLETPLAEPRKVSDARRKLDAIATHHRKTYDIDDDSDGRSPLCSSCGYGWPCETVRIIESTEEPAQ